MKFIKDWWKRVTGVAALEMKIEKIQSDMGCFVKDIHAMNTDIVHLTYSVNKCTHIVKEQTSVSSDLHHKEESLVMVAGRWRNNDYVRLYTIADESMDEIVNHLRCLEEHHGRGRHDPFTFGIDMKTFIDRS